MKYDANKRTKEQVKLLVSMLDSEYEEARTSALVQLTQIGKDAVPYIASELDQKELDSYSLPYLFKALGIIGDPSAIPVLARLVERISKAEEVDEFKMMLVGTAKRMKTIPMTIIEALSKIGTRDILPVLIGAAGLLEEDERSTENIVGVFKEFGDSGRDALLEALHSESASARAGAVSLLGTLREKKAMNGLIKLLKAGNEKEKELVVEALGMIGDRTAVPHLLQTLKNGLETEYGDRTTSILIYRSLLALGKIGDASAVPEIIKLTIRSSYRYPESRKWARDVIRKMGERAKSGLMEVMDKGSAEEVEFAGDLIASLKKTAFSSH